MHSMEISHTADGIKTKGPPISTVPTDSRSQQPDDYRQRRALLKVARENTTKYHKSLTEGFQYT